jgi:hypothetical protein
MLIRKIKGENEKSKIDVRMKTDSFIFMFYLMTLSVA